MAVKLTQWANGKERITNNSKNPQRKAISGMNHQHASFFITRRGTYFASVQHYMKSHLCVVMHTPFFVTRAIIGESATIEVKE